MDLIQQTKNYFSPQEETISTQCKKYIQDNPGIVAKGAAVGVSAGVTAPLVMTVVGWVPYVAGGYSVRKIDDKVAVMVHTTTADGEKYTSMHVWRKHDGKWKVAASASVEND